MIQLSHKKHWRHTQQVTNSSFCLLCKSCIKITININLWIILVNHILFIIFSLFTMIRLWRTKNISYDEHRHAPWWWCHHIQSSLIGGAATTPPNNSGVRRNTLRVRHQDVTSSADDKHLKCFDWLICRGFREFRNCIVTLFSWQ